MKLNGIVCKLDEFGRITLPMELRKNLHMSERQELEIYVEESNIILKKAERDLDLCYCCQERKPIITLYDRGLCQDCIDRYYNAKRALAKREDKPWTGKQ